MAEDVHIEPARLQVILESVDPAKDVAQYYVLPVEQTLFARYASSRHVGSSGREQLRPFASGGGAPLALNVWLERKRRVTLTAK